MSEPVILHEFEKARSTVRAYIADFKGRRYCHIREFVEPRDHPGADLIATKAGICVELDDLDELQACIDALRTAVAAPPAGRSTERARIGRRSAVADPQEAA